MTKLLCRFKESMSADDDAALVDDDWLYHPELSHRFG
jgi:hypothetical protein